MINPQKVRAMTQNALFEHHEGRHLIKLNDYCENRAVWKSLAGGTLAGILLYVLILLIAVLADPSWFAGFASKVGDVWMAVIIALSLAAFTSAYTIISDIIFRSVYTRRRSELCRYRAGQRRLEIIEREQEKHENRI